MSGFSSIKVKSAQTSVRHTLEEYLEGWQLCRVSEVGCNCGEHFGRFWKILQHSSLSLVLPNPPTIWVWVSSLLLPAWKHWHYSIQLFSVSQLHHEENTYEGHRVAKIVQFPQVSSNTDALHHNLRPQVWSLTLNWNDYQNTPKLTYYCRNPCWRFVESIYWGENSGQASYRSFLWDSSNETLIRVCSRLDRRILWA